MAEKIELFRVFISSPADVISERNAAIEAIEEINRIRGSKDGFLLQAVSWDRNVRPAVGAEP